MDIHVYFHNDESELRGRLEHIHSLLNALLDQGKTIMATLADLQTAVTAEDTVIDSAITLIKGLAAQIAALPPDQAAIDALAADVKGTSDALAAAVAANTGGAPK
jgi:ABC-type transporter Mla subunit MlaD